MPPETTAPPATSPVPAPRSGQRTAVTEDGVRRPVGTIALVAASTGLTGWLVGSAVSSVVGDQNAPWILGRASGIAGYVLMVALVVMGLLLSHPWRTRWRRPSAVVRIRVHVSLAVFTLAFLALHVLVLATDSYAEVGWWGAVLPMASGYRPVAVTLGVIAAYAGVLAGVTALFAGHWAARVWWPVHKVAGLALVATWLHAVLAGSDTGVLIWLYAGTAVVVLGLAASRYVAKTPSDRLTELTRGTGR